MNNKLITTIIKPLSSTIGWLGGGIAGITVILSSIGFLVLRSHHELLGVTGVIPRPPETWTIEGARFLYNSLFFLVGGLLRGGWILLLLIASVLLIVLWVNEKWSAKITDFFAKYPLLKMLLAIISFVGIIVVIGVFVQSENVSNLLVKHQTFDDELVKRSQKENIEELNGQYALLVMLLVLFFLWIRSLSCLLNISKDKAEQDSVAKNSALFSRFSVWYAVLWVFFLIPLLLLPMNYGKLVKPNDFYRVRLFTENKPANSTEKSQTPDEEGWLLYQDQNILVIYRGSASEEPIQILGREHFARIHIVGLENIFTER